MSTPLAPVYGSSNASAASGGGSGGGETSSSNPLTVVLDNYFYFDAGTGSNFTSGLYAATVSGGVPDVTVEWSVTYSSPFLALGINDSTSLSTFFTAFVTEPGYHTGQITLTATDNVGNTASRTVSVEIFKQTQDGTLEP